MAEIKNDTPVVVPEQQANANKYKEYVKEGVAYGAGVAAGIGAVFGLSTGAVWLGGQIVNWAGKKIEASKAKRAAKKAAKADKGGEA